MHMGRSLARFGNGSWMFSLRGFLIVSCGRVIFPDLTKAMKMIQTLDHGQREPAGPLPERGRNLPARLYPRQTFQKMDRFHTPLEEAVLTTDTVRDRRPVFPFTGDPIQETIRQVGI
jgi:hypothetical protein